MMKGAWQKLDVTGSIPDSREGATMVYYNKLIYLFGGQARDRYNCIHTFDETNGNHWVRIENDDPFAPAKRFAHTMNLWGNYSVVLAGAGNYV